MNNELNNNIPTAASPSSDLRPPSSALLHDLVQILNRFVVLPKHAPETLALWILHTYAFHLRDVTTYVGIESPEKRCGKTTLLSILNELCNRALASSNISPPAFFRVIEDMSPTLLIDEVDTFLTGNDQLRGILNAGYKKKTAFVLRASAALPATEESDDSANSAPPDAVRKYSCWCPKALAKIGHFPDTLADRCIIIRMQRKTPNDACDRLRDFDSAPLKEACSRFIEKNAPAIASARPAIPKQLNDRAADIWEPLFVLADIAGGDWPELARQAALNLTVPAQELSPITSLLLDLFTTFSAEKAQQIGTATLIELLLSLGIRPWNEGIKFKDITHVWLARQLRPYGAHPRNIRIGDRVLKGYDFDDLLEVFRRYLPKSVIQAWIDENTPPEN